MEVGWRKPLRLASLVMAALVPFSGLASAQELTPPSRLPDQPAAQPLLGAPEPLAAPQGTGPVPPAVAGPGGPAAPTPVSPLGETLGPLASVLPAPLEQPSNPGQNGWGPYELPASEQGPTSDFWFVILEAQILRPFVKNAIVGTVQFQDGTSNTISPPSASLNWTGAPWIEVGYRLPQALGQFSLAYRFLGADGSGSAVDPIGIPYSLRSHLYINTINFDYGTVPYMIYPHWFLQARIGVSIGDLYFDTRATSATDNQFDKNNFLGGGPRARIDLYRNFGIIPGLALFGRLDGTLLVGQIDQHFNESVQALDGSTLQGSALVRRTQAVPILIVQAGLMYTPPRLPNMHFAAGYMFEKWWDVGEIDNYPSRGNYLANGLFLRSIIDF